MVELVGTEYPMPDDLPDRDLLRGEISGGSGVGSRVGSTALPRPSGPPPGSPAGLATGSAGHSGNAMETAWRRWREAVSAVHEGLASEDLRPWELQELFDAERSARRVCAAVLHVAGHEVPEYLTDPATLSPLWPPPDRPA
jgi:hypothetical protein